MSGFRSDDTARQCRYCSGTGMLPVEQPKPERALRGPSSRMIPFGNDVAIAINEGRMNCPPLLLVNDEPIRNSGGKIIGFKKSRWDVAKEALEKGFPCMVLPEGQSVDSFSWPKQPDDWQRYWGHSLMVYAFTHSADECGPIGEALVKAGFDSVSILCNSPHLLNFKAG